MQHCILVYQNETKELSGRAQDGSQCVCVTPDGKDMCASLLNV